MGLHDQTAFSDNVTLFQERRCYPRFSVALTGVCSVAGSSDVACVIYDLSLGGAAVRCDGTAAVGDRVILSMPLVGLLEGRIVRTMHNAFAVAFEGRGAQRGKRIGDYLAFIILSAEEPDREDRVHQRLVPLQRIVAITRADGRSHMARIIDASRSGIALTTTVAVSVGELIVVGSTAAEIVRIFDGGLAARFKVPLDTTFDATIVF